MKLIRLLLIFFCIGAISTLNAQSDETTEMEDTDGLEADNWKFRHLGFGPVFGKPIHVGVRVIGQVSRFGVGVEAGRDNFTLSRKTDFDANVYRVFSLFRVTYDTEELFKIYGYGGYTMYQSKNKFEVDYGDFAVVDAGIQGRLQLNFITISTDIGWAIPISDNEYYQDQHLEGLNIGLAIMFWPF